MRLIDIDPILEIVDNTRLINKVNVQYFLGAMDTIKAIAQQPTIDAVPVVRCKDCKHRYQYEDWDRGRQESFVCHECRLHQKDFGEEGFCSYGERKDGAEKCL